MKFSLVRLSSRLCLPGSKERVTDEYWDITHDLQSPWVQFTNRSDGRIYLVPVSSVYFGEPIVDYVPEHQPLGTPESRDTPTGQKRNYGATAEYKERISKAKPRKKKE